MKSYHADTFLIRYNDGTTKLLSEQEAHDEWDVRANDAYWLTLQTVSLMPGNQFGIGQAIIF